MGTPIEDLILAAVSAHSVAEIDALPTTTLSVMVFELDDAKAEALSRLPELRCVTGDGNCRISDNGLDSLVRLENLRVLDLEWSSGITNVGLSKLGQLRLLRFLDVSFCRQITLEAVGRLRALLPECEVEFYGA